MDISTKQNLRRQGFVVLKSAFVDHEISEAVRHALCKWHETSRNLDDASVRYCHCPKFFDGLAGPLLLEPLFETAAEILGAGNVDRSIAPQLLGYPDGRIPSPRQAKRHIDNIPNCLELRKQIAAEKGVPVETVPIPYPGFNLIVGVFLTHGRLRVWPGSHEMVSDFYRSSDDMKFLIESVRAEVVDKLGVGETLDCEPGDIVVINHILAHAACNSPQPDDSKWIVEGLGQKLAVRCYVRPKSINPKPAGLATMQDPWNGCWGLPAK